MSIADLLNYVVSQVLEGERVSIWIFQYVFAFGIATVIHNMIPSIPLCVLISLLILVALLYSYFHAKLENLFNNTIFQLMDELMDINEVVNFINSVLFNEHNLLNDIFNVVTREHRAESTYRKYLIILRVTFNIIAPSVFLLTTIVLLFLIFINIFSSKFLDMSIMSIDTGYMLIILSYIFVVIFGVKPAHQASPSTENMQMYQHLISTVIEKYTYENIVKAKSIPKLLVSAVALLFPITKLDFKKPSLWFGLYMCSGKLYGLIEELEEKENADIKGEVVEFFQCDKLDGAEKWIELHEISTEEMLEKIMGKQLIEKDKQLKSQLRKTQRL